MRKFLVVGLLALLSVGLFQVGPCGMFGAETIAGNLDWCEIINCDGTAIWDPCEGQIVLADCFDSGGRGGTGGSTGGGGSTGR